jgi:hypothetical protein
MEVDAQPQADTQPRPVPRAKGKKGQKQHIRAFLSGLGEEEREQLVEELVKDLGH